MIHAESVPETLATRAGDLFAAFRGGDESKMAALVSLLTPILWHTARAQRLDRESAEDVLQSAWLALVRNRQSIDDPRAVLMWLIVTVRRESWRVARVQQRSEPQDFESDQLVAADVTPDLAAVSADERGRLWEHVEKLPERCRTLLRVIAFADRPDYAAIAKALDMPIGSIGPTRGRCLAKLRAQLASDPGWEFS